MTLPGLSGAPGGLHHEKNKVKILWHCQGIYVYYCTSTAYIPFFSAKTTKDLVQNTHYPLLWRKMTLRLIQSVLWSLCSICTTTGLSTTDGLCTNEGLSTVTRLCATDSLCTTDCFFTTAGLSTSAGLCITAGLSTIAGLYTASVLLMASILLRVSILLLASVLLLAILLLASKLLLTSKVLQPLCYCLYTADGPIYYCLPLYYSSLYNAAGSIPSYYWWPLNFCWSLRSRPLFCSWPLYYCH